MSKTLKFSLPVLIGTLFLFLASPVSALTITGGTTQSTITSNTSSVELSNVQITCNADNEITTTNGLILSLNYLASGSYNSATNPVIFDTSSVITASYAPPGTNGVLLSSPQYITESQIKFTSTTSCKNGQNFWISGIKVKPSSTIKKEGSERIYAQSTAFGVSNNTFAVDNAPPTIVSGVVLGTEGYTTDYTLFLTFSENIVYNAFASAHWQMTPVSSDIYTRMGELQLSMGKGDSENKLNLFAVPKYTAIATNGYWNLSTTSSNTLTDLVGNKIITQQVVVNDSVNPVITSVSPASGTVASVNTPIIIKFSEAMDSNNVSVTLNPAIQYTKQWSSNFEQLTIIPSNQAYSTSYSVTISGKSLNGGETLWTAIPNQGSKPLLWTYSTQSAPIVTDPSGTVSIANGASETTSATVSVSVSATNADLVQFGFKSDLSDAGNYETVTALKSLTLPPTLNTSQVCARFKNNSNGKVSPIVCDLITLVKKGYGAPTGGTLLINNGANATYSNTVTLLFASVNATHMVVSNDSSFADSSWEPLVTTKLWILPAGLGTKNIYVMYKSSNGAVSDVVSSSINVESQTNTVVPSGTFTIGSGNSTTQSIFTSLTISATNADQMQFGATQDLQDVSAYEPLSSLKSWILKPSLSAQYICVRFRNSTYNTTSSIVCKTITLSTDGSGKPTNTSILLNDGATSTNSSQVIIKLGASGASKMAISNDISFSGASWETFTTQKYHTLTYGSGYKQVYVLLASDTGAVTGPLSASINLSTQTLISPQSNIIDPPKGPTDIRALPSGMTGGMLVKGPDPKKKAVYYIGANGYRYVFPTESVFLSWYTKEQLETTDKGGSVIVIGASTLASMPVGGNVTFRPGSVMVKLETDPRTYAVDKNGVLRWIKSEQTANAIYGYYWSKLVRVVSDALFVNYGFGTDINGVSDFYADSVKANSYSIEQDKGIKGK